MKRVKFENLQPLLDAAKPTMDRMVKTFISFYPVFHNGEEATKRDIEFYEYGIVVDFIKAFGNYILPTDLLKIVDVKSQKGVIVFELIVTRDEELYALETRMIEAGGYNIQCHHFRYIVTTKLRSLNQPHPAVKALIDERKRMTKVERLQADLASKKSYHAREISRFKEGQTKTDEDIIRYNHLTEELNRWERLNEYAKEMYGTAEAFYADKAQKRAEAISKHRARHSEKELAKMLKRFDKEAAAIQTKIDALEK